MLEIRDQILGALETVLEFLHDVFYPAFGDNSWGWAIIALTLIVRVLLLPLAIKQTRSMRAMQAIQPQMKALQKKYKVDRELMKKDPEQYKAKKAKLNEEMMALYREEGANPAASCLPLLAQAPIFLALFWTLNRSDDLAGAPFYFITRFVSPESDATGLAAVVSQAGWPGWLLIVLMSGTMFYSQKQMMARTAMTQGDGANPMAQQQKILLYVMPLFLAVISFQFPLGILLYWVTTNAWQVVQQAIILREVQAETASGTLKDKPGGEVADDPQAGSGTDKRRSPGASSGTKPVPKPKKSGGQPSGKNHNTGSSKNKGKPSGSSKSTGKKHTDGSASERSKDAGGSKAKDTGGDDNKPSTPSKDAGKGRSKPDSNGKPPSGRTDSTPSNGSGKGAGAARPPKRDHLPRRPRR